MTLENRRPIIFSVRVPAAELPGHLLLQGLDQRVRRLRPRRVLLVDRHVRRRRVERQPEHRLAGRPDDLRIPAAPGGAEHVVGGGRCCWRTSPRSAAGPGAGTAARCTTASTPSCRSSIPLSASTAWPKSVRSTTEETTSLRGLGARSSATTSQPCVDQVVDHRPAELAAAAGDRHACHVLLSPSSSGVPGPASPVRRRPAGQASGGGPADPAGYSSSGTVPPAQAASAGSTTRQACSASRRADRRDAAAGQHVGEHPAVGGQLAGRCPAGAVSAAPRAAPTAGSPAPCTATPLRAVAQRLAGAQHEPGAGPAGGVHRQHHLGERLGAAGRGDAVLGGVVRHRGRRCRPACRRCTGPGGCSRRGPRGRPAAATAAGPAWPRAAPAHRRSPAAPSPAAPGSGAGGSAARRAARRCGRRSPPGPPGPASPPRPRRPAGRPAVPVAASCCARSPWTTGIPRKWSTRVTAASSPPLTSASRALSAHGAVQVGAERLLHRDPAARRQRRGAAAPAGSPGTAPAAAPGRPRPGRRRRTRRTAAATVAGSPASNRR